MNAEITYFAAFLVGLTGGVHCIGMCGGIVGALSLGLPAQVQNRYRRLFPFLFAYNFGRIASYTAAGALMGALGALAADLVALHQARLWLGLLAGLFMVALGLYIAGWWQGLLAIERAGGALWRRIEPFARRLLPVHSTGQALLLGMVWGWIPCGLVYTALIWAISAGGALEGGLLLASFGLGTLPNLMAMGLAAARLSALLRRPWVRRAAGLTVLLLGLLMLGQTLGGLLSSVPG